MKKYICISCGYVYDPEKESPPIAFEDLPDDWLCPMCYAGKTDFDPLD